MLAAGAPAAVAGMGIVIGGGGASLAVAAAEVAPLSVGPFLAAEGSGTSCEDGPAAEAGAGASTMTSVGNSGVRSPDAAGSVGSPLPRR
jgi:hypothetical protein